MSTRAANRSGGVLTRGESGGDAAPPRRATRKHVMCGIRDDNVHGVDNLLLPGPGETSCAFSSLSLLFLISRFISTATPRRSFIGAARAARCRDRSIDRAGKSIGNFSFDLPPTACRGISSSLFLSFL